MATIDRIRQCVQNRRYLLSSHADEEMLADWLERADIEFALRYGELEKRFTHDARGVRYRIEGPARNGRMLHVLARFLDEDRLLIVTVYALEKNDEM